ENPGWASRNLRPSWGIVSSGNRSGGNAAMWQSTATARYERSAITARSAPLTAFPGRSLCHPRPEWPVPGLGRWCEAELEGTSRYRQVHERLAQIYDTSRLIHGPTARVSHSGSFFHISIRLRYRGLSVLLTESSCPARTQN